MNTISQKPISPIDTALKSSRSQHAMTPKPGKYNIFISIGANFDKIRSHRYLGKKIY